MSYARIKALVLTYHQLPPSSLIKSQTNSLKVIFRLDYKNLAIFLIQATVYLRYLSLVHFTALNAFGILVFTINLHISLTF